MSSNGGRVARVAGALLVFGATLIGIAGPASAGVLFSAGPSVFPGTSPPGVPVGSTGLPAVFTVTNSSTSPDNVGSLVVNSMKLVPSCSTFNSGCSGGIADPGVFQLSSTGVGEAGTACAGQVFSINVVNPATGEVSFVPASPVALGPPGSSTSTCRIDFTVNVLKVPSVDADPVTAGVQTRQVGSAQATNSVTGSVGFGSGSSTSTVVRATPTITTTASPSVPVGSTIQDTANLAGGVGPTGTITFNLYGPFDPTCTAPPLFTNTVPVAGNGTYSSSPFVATQSGTYRFRASYSGDVNNNPTSGACGDPAEAVVVARATPQITTTASPSVSVGGTINDTATLSGGFNPTGTITFNLYGPSDVTCAGPPIFTSTVPVAGSGNFPSGQFAPVTAGTYRWTASYSGDANNNPTGPTPCGAVGESVVVTAAPTTPSRPLLGDFNGDGLTDIAVWRPSNGTWYVKGFSETVWGQAGDIPVPGDYAGDATSELAVWRPSNGTWYIRGVSETVYGLPGDIPVPADYNGDGKLDIAVFRPSNGTWYVRGISETVWGTSGDIPVPADYGGDIRADIAVFRPSNGSWYVKDISFTAWGVAGDIPVPANYGGDPKADIAVFRPSNGSWYVKDISFTAWGVAGDIPVPGDYNGGGTDIAVWRPSNSYWYVRSVSVTLWGLSTDIPV